MSKRHPAAEFFALDFSDPELFANRELSWLAFNRRVLEEAEDPGVPLLEKLKFLGIVTSNLDEFFMVRVAGLKELDDAGVATTQADGLKPSTVLERIAETVHEFTTDQYTCYRNEVLPALDREGIAIRRVADLPPSRASEIGDFFNSNIAPVLTPLAIDPAHPFPFLANLSLNLVILFEHDDADRHDTGLSAEAALAIVRVPPVLPRLVPVVSHNYSQCYVLLEDVIASHIGRLFPGLIVQSVHAFRVTRNSDLSIEDDDIDNLLQHVDQELRHRRFREVVRLELDASTPTPIRRVLTEALDVTEADTYEIEGPINLAGLGRIYKECKKPSLKDPPFNPRISAELDTRADIFSMLRERDVLLHHPYDSFSTVVELLQSAAEDERVLAIKQTLYRTSGDSPIIDALIQAAENGKQVSCVVELRARFDEHANIQWARTLEETGVHVVYGVIGLKTHAKCALVVRQETDGLRRYAHLGTGNYNPATARLYTDLGLLTSDPDLSADVATLFNLMTGFNYKTGASILEGDADLPWRKLLVAPINLHQAVQKLIRYEIRRAAKGKPARIIAVMNQLVDAETIANLYRASCAGVDIDLIVRGICCLKPGIEGVSENIRVTSIVDRFLEHPRIFYFLAGGEEKVLCGSADWMPRNFFRRIEAVFPIENEDHKRRIIDQVLAIQLADNTKARRGRPDGTYKRRKAKGKEPLIRSQEALIRMAREAGFKSAPYDDALKDPTAARRKAGK